MLGSGANLNLEALGGSETDYLAVGELLWCRVKTAATRLRHNDTNVLYRLWADRSIFGFYATYRYNY